MQEEVNQKVISLSIQGARITANVLKAAMRKFLDVQSRRKQRSIQIKQAEKTGKAQEKGREKARQKIERSCLSGYLQQKQIRKYWRMLHIN